LRLLSDLGSKAEGLIERMYEMFVRGVPPALVEIEEALETDHLDRAARLAHALRSSCSFVAANQMLSMSAALEEAAQKGQADQARELLTQLKTAYPPAAQALAALAQKLRKTGP